MVVAGAHGMFQSRGISVRAGSKITVRGCWYETGSARTYVRTTAQIELCKDLAPRRGNAHVHLHAQVALQWSKEQARTQRVRECLEGGGFEVRYNADSAEMLRRKLVTNLAEILGIKPAVDASAGGAVAQEVDAAEAGADEVDAAVAGAVEVDAAETGAQEMKPKRHWNEPCGVRRCGGASEVFLGQVCKSSNTERGPSLEDGRSRHHLGSPRGTLQCEAAVTLYRLHSWATAWYGSQHRGDRGAAARDQRQDWEG